MYPQRKEVKNLGIKKGAKLTDNPKDYMLRVRIGKEMLEQLDSICKEQKLSRSEVIRNWIKMQYQSIKK